MKTTNLNVAAMACDMIFGMSYCKNSPAEKAENVENAQEVIVNLPGIEAKKAVGEILTSKDVTDYNSFENPEKVKPAPFKEVKINKGVMKIKLPAKSIVTVELQ